MYSCQRLSYLKNQGNQECHRKNDRIQLKKCTFSLMTFFFCKLFGVYRNTDTPRIAGPWAYDETARVKDDPGVRPMFELKNIEQTNFAL